MELLGASPHLGLGLTLLYSPALPFPLCWGAHRLPHPPPAQIQPCHWAARLGQWEGTRLPCRHF